ncbi:hypothetical protein ACQ4N7_22305 [Nodosilinea sp. AN01ver1]|uniref:hypothetical protein n=1 Tax=Nodosilinea sp. AN01ver1 TaxID=3423362 RepID=UPI003D31E86B
MVKAFILAIAGLIWILGLPVYNADASIGIFCQDVASHQVCLETIKRSAKYVWQYRVTVSIDGERQPVKYYDCRSFVISPDESTTPSNEVAIRQLICDLVIH